MDPTRQEDEIRRLRPEDLERPHPVHVVWEITLACDLKCSHCGSRALKPRPDELSTEECLDVVRQLHRLGAREITLIGGEAYLRKDWTTIVREIRDLGMRPTMQTGGRNFTEARMKAAADAGLMAIGVSIDGMRELHDELRGFPGSFDSAFRTLEMAKKYGLRISANTQISSRVRNDLRPLFERLIEVGAETWQIQLTVAMGRAADNSDLLLQPYEILEIYPKLFELYLEGRKRGLRLSPGNNLGYFGPFEAHWRGGNEQGREFVHWIGCNAGHNTLGIEADGTIKGCPSLPTQPYAGGNVRDLTIEQIWNEAPELRFTRTRTEEELWGFCKTCYYADVCRGGCSWTSHTLLGRRGNNPYCHHRALTLADQGKRERIVKVKDAEGLPFDYGGFEIVEEPLDAPLPEPERSPGHARLPVIA